MGVLTLVSQPAASEDGRELSPGKRYALSCLLDELCTRRLFFDVAGLRSNPEAGIVKWTRPLDLLFEPERPPNQGEIVSALRSAHEAAVASGLPAAQDKATSKDALPFWIVFGDDAPTGEETPRDLRSSLLLRTAEGLAANPERPCRAHLEFSAGQADPVAAMLRIRDDVTGHAATTCAVGAFFRIMGLLGTSGAKGFESLLTEGPGNIVEGTPLITTFDHVMLDLLYDPAISAGMDPEAVKAVFHDVYRRIVPSRGERDEQSLTDFVDPIDQQTYDCMADKACMLEHFIVMVISGSDFEPNPNEKIVNKSVLPALVRLVVDPKVDETARRAAERGFNYVMAMASIMRLPHMPVDEDDPKAFTSGLQFVTTEPTEAKNGVFAEWLEQPRLEGLYDLAVSPGLEGNYCTAVTELNRIGYGTTFMMSLIPVSDDWPPELVQRCIIEEGLQSFGVNFDIDGGLQTMFDDLPDNGRLTGFDVFMFALLYHPLIEPGMIELDVRAVFDRVYDEVWSKFSEATWWLEGSKVNQFNGNDR